MPKVLGIFPPVIGVGAGAITAVCVTGEPTVIIVPVIFMFFI
jgi:hypothetical protein